jgi:hypothetical protein
MALFGMSRLGERHHVGDMLAERGCRVFIVPQFVQPCLR